MILKNTPTSLVIASALMATSALLPAKATPEDPPSNKHTTAEATSEEVTKDASSEKIEVAKKVLAVVAKTSDEKKGSEKDDPARDKLEKEKAQLALENSLAAERSERKLADLKAQVAKLKLEKELLAETIAVKELKHKEQQMADQVAFAEETRELSRETQLAKLKAEQLTSELKSQKAELGLAMTKVEREMELFEAKQKRDTFVDAEPVYLADPLKEDGTLVISDRRIDLNGGIYSDTAAQVGERINYFNNKNGEHPIFIVIDSSPGGSVMAGMQILKAMHGSQAPVYVVVKSFAASMAAGITTLAERSFALPDAILLHHQILSLSYGNLSETREHTKQMEQWWNRLAGPVAEKMGITLEEFIDKMYNNTVTGDWTEFADDAQKIKWVDHVVSNVQETSLLKNPDAQKPEKSANATYLEAGRPGNIIPRLNPKDMLYLYNPDQYYHRAEK
jgi:ATP-dependent Clp protease protease subunit